MALPPINPNRCRLPGSARCKSRIAFRELRFARRLASLALVDDFGGSQCDDKNDGSCHADYPFYACLRLAALCEAASRDQPDLRCPPRVS